MSTPPDPLAACLLKAASSTVVAGVKAAPVASSALPHPLSASAAARAAAQARSTAAFRTKGNAALSGSSASEKTLFPVIAVTELIIAAAAPAGSAGTTKVPPVKCVG